ncbi:RlmE family RNA methyltransferase [Candidatus Peregrinibacteria bacterium]|nr:RlmE family RNA methyltransferase [Candidatus Peregrinibacteria bacterium]
MAQKSRKRTLKRGGYDVYDPFFHRAKEDGFRARSVFKLEEIQNKFSIVRHGDIVLDVGAAPGSFLQYLVRVVGPSGSVTGFDIKAIDGIEGARTFIADIFDDAAVSENISGQTFDVITSDIAPNTSGIKDLDQARSVDLNFRVLELSQKYLKKGGNLLLKVFFGVDFHSLIHAVRKNFERVSVYKPESSRKQSRETYIIAMKKR